MHTGSSTAGSLEAGPTSAAPTVQPGAASRPAPSMDAIARDAGIIWPPAVAVAALGTLICLFAAPGINWGLWAVAASSGLGYVTHRARGRVSWPVVLTLVGASTLALGAGVTGDEQFLAVILLGTAVLLALATLLAQGPPIEDVGFQFMAAAPLVCGLRALAESFTRVIEAVTLARAGRDTRGLRATLIAAPIVGVLALLLSAGDPVLARLRDDAARLVTDSTIGVRLAFFAVLGVVTLGAYGIAARPAAAAAHGSAGPTSMQPRIALADSERLIILGAVAALFALFVVLQVSYLFGNAPAIAGNGVTYADYARRGFGELTVAASLSAFLVLWLDAHAVRGPLEGRVRLTGLSLLFLVQLVLDSAFRRVVLYESAYGYTAARLYAKVYMVIVSLALIALGVEIWGRVDTRRLVRRVAVLGVAAVVGLTYWNHQAWIAQRNLDRFATTGQLDVDYLVTHLSANAVPTIVRALPSLPAAESGRLREQLGKRYHDLRRLRAGHWYEWNLRDREALEALASIEIR